MNQTNRENSTQLSVVNSPCSCLGSLDILEPHFQQVHNHLRIPGRVPAHVKMPLALLDIPFLGQADDCVPVSDDLFSLKNLLELTLDYCNKYHVLLASEKTKLLAFSPPKDAAEINYMELINELIFVV